MATATQERQEWGPSRVPRDHQASLWKTSPHATCSVYTTLRSEHSYPRFTGERTEAQRVDRRVQVSQLLVATARVLLGLVL